MQSRLLIAAIMGAAFVLCAGTTPSASGGPPPAPPTDACALLTQAQVRAVLAVSVGGGERISPDSPKLCAWAEPGGMTANKKRVLTALITVDMFMHEKHPLQGITEKQLSGVGDEAHYMTTPGFGTGLSVKKGGFVFKVRVYGFSQDQVEAKEKTLALDVLAKL
jgi:hypothetical protein